MLVVDCFVLVIDFIHKNHCDSRAPVATMAVFVQINCRRCVAAQKSSLNYIFSLPF